MLALGIDGGGSKTGFLLADTNQGILAECCESTLDFKQIGIDGVEKVIRQGAVLTARQCGKKTEDIQAVCAGVPCLGEYQNWDSQCLSLFTKIFPQAEINCVNDVQVGFYGSLFLQPGIHLVAGTGAIALGRDPSGRWMRSGGWGEHFSDEGSCYWLGLKACELFSKEADRRVERGPLYSLWMEKLGLQTPFDFISLFDSQYLGNRKRIARLQLLLEEAADAGDTAAQSLYRAAAQELAMNLRAIYRHLDFPGRVSLSYSGGLFRCGRWLMEPLQAAVGDLPADWKSPLFSPVEGALLYALCRLLSMEENQAADLIQCGKRSQAAEGSSSPNTSAAL